MREQNRFFAILGLAAVTGTALAGNPTLILDDFDSEPNDDAGGPRAVSLMEIANPFGQIGNFEVDTMLDIGSDEGAAVFNSGIGVQQQGDILWDNDGAGLSLDAVALGLIGFELDFALIDLDFSYEIALTDGAGDSIGASGTWLAGGERTESITLGDFTESALFDATDVDAVSISFNIEGDTASLDFILTEFRAVVPTPGSFLMLGLGGLLCVRRRR